MIRQKRQSIVLSPDETLGRLLRQWPQAWSFRDFPIPDFAIENQITKSRNHQIAKYSITRTPLATSTSSLIARGRLRLRVCSDFARSLVRARGHRFARARGPTHRLGR